jgi:hypothetical protein
MNQTSQPIQACLEAWMHCENLLLTLARESKSFSQRTQQVIEECAQVCLGTGHAVKNGLANKHQLALLCVGLCEECAEICERYSSFLFRQCAMACRQCSASITSIASAAV